MLLGCSWDCCSKILFWALCVLIVPRPTPVSMSPSRPLSSKPDSSIFWGFLFALQALLMDTDSWVFTHEIRTGRFNRGCIRDEVVTLGCSPVMRGGCCVAWPYLALTAAPWHHKKEDFSTFLKRAAVLCWLRRGMERFSLQACRNLKHGRFPGSVSGIPIALSSREPDLHPSLAAPAGWAHWFTPCCNSTEWLQYRGGVVLQSLCLALPAWLPLSPSLSITPVRITFQSFPTGKHHLQPVMHFVSLQKVIPIEVSTSVIYVIKIWWIKSLKFTSAGTRVHKCTTCLQLCLPHHPTMTLSYYLSFYSVS